MIANTLNQWGQHLAQWKTNRWWPFLLPPEPRSWSDIIGWWEWRRLPYNLAIAAAGFVSLLLSAVFALMPPHSPELAFGEADLGLSFFASFFMANLCYTSGWLIEIVARQIGGDWLRYFGPIAYMGGLAFSLLIALSLPTFCLGSWLLRVMALLS